MPCPVWPFLIERVGAGLIVIWSTQDIEQFVNAAVVSLFGAVDRLLGQVVAQHVARVGAIHSFAAFRTYAWVPGTALDTMNHERASVVALTVAQSAAMEYYDRIVDEMFGKTDALVDRMEKAGTVPLTTRPLHRFIGQAMGTRNEAISILHLLDRPDALWDDPGADSIYEQLRAEFDLVDRYQALELKLRAVQEALELLVDVARDRRLVLLEASIVVLIVLEIVLSLVRH